MRRIGEIFGDGIFTAGEKIIFRWNYFRDRSVQKVRLPFALRLSKGATTIAVTTCFDYASHERNRKFQTFWTASELYRLWAQ
jgi:hypothetical protein